MILGVLSDTHLTRPGKDFEELLEGPLGSADALVHAGDHVGPEVLDYLEFVDKRPYYGVFGNMDPDPVRRRLRESRIFHLEGTTIGLIHGWGSPKGIEERILASFAVTPDLLIYGHSHLPKIEKWGNTLLVNPGSAFDKRFAPFRSVALIKIGDHPPQAKIVELGP